ncbi:MAG: lysophospholipid acyltransferase family protein [Anaeroplasmataceae bacterium]
MLLILLIVVTAALMSFMYYKLLPVFLNGWSLAIYILGGILSAIIIWILITLLMVLFFRATKCNNKLKHKILWQYTDLILFAGRIKVEIVGKENIPSEPCVVYGNHKSMIDPVIIYNSYKKVMTAAAKKTLGKIKILKYIMDSLGVILIDRENDREAMKEIIRGIKNINDYNIGYMIFPEGGIKTRETEQMHDVKPGSYKLATKANAVISPVSIIGSSKIASRRLFTITKIKLVIHKPIYPEEYNNLSTIELGDKVLNIVNEGVKNGR